MDSILLSITTPYARLAGLAFALLVAGCGGGEPPALPPPEVEASGQAAGTANRGFGAALYVAAVKGRERENVILSPVSAQLALALVAQSAVGETRSEILTVLGVEEMSRETLTEGFRELSQALGMRGDVAVTLANSVWVREGFPLKSGFLDLARSGFAAEAQALNFSRPDAAATINRWVGEQTRGRIKDLIQQVETSHVMETQQPLVFDRPFLVGIVDHSTGALLFLGQVTNPTTSP